MVTSGVSTGSTTATSCAAARSPATTPAIGARTSLPSSSTGNGKLEPVRRLPDCDPLVAERERLPADLGERPAAEACERLRRAEPRAGAADEQNAGQASIRHGSV